MITYKVQTGDSLWSIKEKLGLPVSIEDIVRVNPIIKKPEFIQAGWELKLPETLEEIKAGRRLELISLRERLRKITPKLERVPLRKEVTFEDLSKKMMTEKELAEWKKSEAESRKELMKPLRLEGRLKEEVAEFQGLEREPEKFLERYRGASPEAQNILRERYEQIVPKVAPSPTLETIKGAAIYALKGRAGAGAELKAQIKQVIPKVKEVLAPKVTLLKETIKGLPEASKTVLGRIFGPKAPEDRFYNQILRFITWPLFTPSKEELQKAIDKMENLKKENLPLEVWEKEMKRIIGEIERR